MLSDVDLELEPGRITALVGPSGSGKSTLARLLMRLADPTAGRIACAGVDLRELDPERWREQIAWVPQRPTLFTGTVAENIALYAPDATRVADRAGGAGRRRRSADRRAAAGSRHARSGTAAGGCRPARPARRARARLPRDRPLLVLDEPTAHLDEHSALALAGAIERLARGRTTLLIVHHPALSEIADSVRRVHDGRLLAAPDAQLAAAPTIGLAATHAALAESGGVPA